VDTRSGTADPESRVAASEIWREALLDEIKWMKNYLPRATPVAVRGDYDKEPCAASAREKVIACLSTASRPRCNSVVRNVGNARVQHRTLDILAECLIASAAKPRDRWQRWTQPTETQSRSLPRAAV